MSRSITIEYGFGIVGKESVEESLDEFMRKNRRVEEYGLDYGYIGDCVNPIPRLFLKSTIQTMYDGHMEVDPYEPTNYNVEVLKELASELGMVYDGEPAWYIGVWVDVY